MILTLLGYVCLALLYCYVFGIMTLLTLLAINLILDGESKIWKLIIEELPIMLKEAILEDAKAIFRKLKNIYSKLSRKLKYNHEKGYIVKFLNKNG